MRVKHLRVLNILAAFFVAELIICPAGNRAPTSANAESNTEENSTNNVLMSIELSEVDSELVNISWDVMYMSKNDFETFKKDPPANLPPSKLLRIEGANILRPKANNSSLNLLDTPISLKLENVSTWEALKKTIIQINKSVNPESHLRIFLRYGINSLGAPDEFTDRKTITLDIDHQSARIAICKIFSQSPLRMAYYYENIKYKQVSDRRVLNAQLDIFFFDKTGQLGKHFRDFERFMEDKSGDYFERWQKEIEEANQYHPAKSTESKPN